MSKIIRKSASIFAGNLTAGSDEVEQFGSKVVSGTPNYTVDPAVIQALSAWGDGWLPALNPTNNSEYVQDRNGVDLVATYQIAYILQQGIPEWDSGTTYYTNSFVQYNGALYISVVDSNINNTPPTASNSYWTLLLFVNTAKQPTKTVLTSGSGTYTPPTGCAWINARLIGAGGGGAGSTVAGSAGGNTVLGASTAYGGAGGSGAGGGAGGAAAFGSFYVPGARGNDGLTAGFGGAGGASIFGGAGPGYTSPGYSASVNSGSGGGGGYQLGGGGAGGYGEITIVSPSAMSYSVGAAGAAGTGTYAGGTGGSGIIIIDEFYY